MTTYGWYFNEGSVIGTSEDEWALLASAVERCSRDQLAQLRVGPIRSLSIEHMLDAEDVSDILTILLDDGLPITGLNLATRLVDQVRDCNADEVFEGTAYVSDDGVDALARIIADASPDEPDPDVVIQWARDRISLDPDSVCDGDVPVPIEYVNGAWRYGQRRLANTDPQAVITYATEPSPETGHVGWCWWALGKMGDSKTLKDAMAECEKLVRR